MQESGRDLARLAGQKTMLKTYLDASAHPFACVDRAALQPLRLVSVVSENAGREQRD